VLLEKPVVAQPLRKLNLNQTNGLHPPALLSNIITIITHVRGARGSLVVKALCYKPEGRGFDTR
jgi:hypothetical protein